MDLHCFGSDDLRPYAWGFRGVPPSTDDLRRRCRRHAVRLGPLPPPSDLRISHRNQSSSATSTVDHCTSLLRVMSARPQSCSFRIECHRSGSLPSSATCKSCLSHPTWMLHPSLWVSLIVSVAFAVFAVAPLVSRSSRPLRSCHVMRRGSLPRAILGQNTQVLRRTHPLLSHVIAIL